MPRRPQKRTAERPRQRSQSPIAIDPLVGPGNPPHRNPPCAKTDQPRSRHCMVHLATRTSSYRSKSSYQAKYATVMLARPIGTPTFGGPLATASGLIFIGAALDDYLRAFDAKTGAELWTGRLPSAGIATPTSYLWQGRQYVLIAAGGHGEAGAPAGDTLDAFALPPPGEFGPSPWLHWLALPGGRFELHAGMAGIVVLALAVLWWWGRRRRHRRPD